MHHVVSRSIDGLVRRARAPVSLRETLVWCLAACVLLLANLLVVNDGPNLSNDSFQYLSVAENFGEGRFAHTSIVHFETERSHVSVPAPMTTFPAGYPAAIAALHSLGLAREHAGAAISIAAVVLLPLAFYWAAAVLGIGGLGTRFLYAWTLGNASVVTIANSVLSESLFTFLTLCAVLLFVTALRRVDEPRKQTALFIAANALIGLSVLVRYSGLFLFAATGLYVVFLVVRRHDRTALRAAAAMVVSAAIVGLVLVRNHVLVGTWKGGNDAPASRSLVDIVHDFAASVYFLVVGELGPTHAAALQLLFFLIVGIGLVVAAAVVVRRSRVSAWSVDHAASFLALYALTYSALLLYTATTTVISLGPRMLLPILPIVLLLAALAVGRIEESPRARTLAVSLVLATGVYVLINVLSYVKPLPPAPDERVSQLLTESTATGVDVGTWISANVGRDEPVVAAYGQAVGHVLQRDTISLISSAFSANTWDEQDVRSVMRAYDARDLILLEDVDAPEIDESRFLSALLTRPPPKWLRPRIRTPHVAIFEVGD
jgi:hypothetical protein